MRVNQIITVIALLWGQVLYAGSTEDSLISLAEEHFSTAEYDQSLGIYLKLLKSAEERNDSSVLALRNFDVGRSHYFFRSETSNDESMPFLQKAYRLAILTKDSTTQLRAARGVGAIYGEYEQFDSAYYYLNKAIDLALQQQNFEIASGVECIIGEYVLNQTDNVKEAMQHWEQGLVYAEKSESKESKAFVLEKLANGSSLLGNYNIAEQQLSEAERIYESVNSKNGLLNIYALYGHLYKAQGMVDKRSDALEKYTNLTNEVYNENLTRSMAEMKTKFETERKEKENALLQAEIKAKESQQRLIILVFVVLLLLGGSVFGFVYYRSKLRQKSRLAQEQKLRFSAVVESEEKERKRIAKELHDSLGQLLSTAKLNLSALEGEEENQQLTNAMNLVDNAVDEVRNVSHNLMPQSLVRYGLIAAIQQLVDSINTAGKIEVKATMPEKIELPEHVSITLYRVVQEVINNALKYAQATEIVVNIEKQNNNLAIAIKDNGVGFDQNQLDKSGIGLNNIRSRIDLINGSVEINSAKGQGVSVILKMSV